MSMKTQGEEFDAMHILSARYKALTQTPIVDDDYLEVRHAYESALAEFIKRMKANDRFAKGNRYGV